MNHVNATGHEYDKYIDRIEKNQESEFCQGKCTEPINGTYSQPVGYAPVTISDLIIDSRGYICCSHCLKRIENE